MKATRTLIAAALVSTLALASTVFADQDKASGHHNEAASKSGAGHGGTMGGMGGMGMEGMTQMHEKMTAMHKKMASAASPAERQALMAEHMATMQEGMAMMQNMGTGMKKGSGGPMTKDAHGMMERQAMMEERMR